MNLPRIRKPLPRRSQGPQTAAILMYHRVAHLDADVWGLAVEAEQFEQHLAVLRKRFRPRSLSRLLEDVTEDHMEPRTVSVTFDDGYRDNLDNARPALERYEIPATVFVATAGLQGASSFWWDDLVDACFAERPLPENGRLHADGAQLTWSREGTTPEARDRLCRELREQLVTKPPPTIAAFVEQLRDLIDLPPPERTLMDAEELIRLRGDGLVEIGAHTVNHVSLPSLSHTEKLDEIRTSKSDLEHVLDTEVRAFCYPYGDIDADAIDCVRDSGFVCALTVVEEPVVRTSHPLELPRLYVGNWPAEELMHRLETLLQAAP